MTDDGRRSALEAIAAEVAVCTACRLHETRTRAVPGEGNPDTEVMFVGEGPGFNEDRQGRPFVGQAGSLLTELLASVGWRRDEVFITNVVKCRPPGNRDPEPDEIAACSGFLKRQIAALDPALVVTLGRFSMARFMPGARIGQVHGTFRPADPESGAPDALAFAMYHPAAALHQGSLKETLFRDMQGVPAALMTARDRRSDRSQPVEPATELAAEQEVVDAETGEAEGDAVEATAEALETAFVQPVEPVTEPVVEPEATEQQVEVTLPASERPDDPETTATASAAERGGAELAAGAQEPAAPDAESRESRAQLTLF